MHIRHLCAFQSEGCKPGLENSKFVRIAMLLLNRGIWHYSASNPNPMDMDGFFAVLFLKFLNTSFVHLRKFLDEIDIEHLGISFPCRRTCLFRFLPQQNVYSSACATLPKKNGKGVKYFPDVKSLLLHKDPRFLYSYMKKYLGPSLGLIRSERFRYYAIKKYMGPKMVMDENPVGFANVIIKDLAPKQGALIHRFHAAENTTNHVKCSKCYLFSEKLTKNGICENCCNKEIYLSRIGAGAMSEPILEGSYETHKNAIKRQEEMHALFSVQEKKAKETKAQNITDGTICRLRHKIKYAHEARHERVILENKLRRITSDRHLLKKQLNAFDVVFGRFL